MFKLVLITSFHTFWVNMGQCKHWEAEQMDAAAHKVRGKLLVSTEQRTYVVILKGWLTLCQSGTAHLYGRDG